MAASQQVVPGLFVIPTGIVNTFLIDAPDGCVLVDAGLPGRDADILRGVAAAGRRPTDVRHLIVTHAHPDHIGSLAAVRAATGAGRVVPPGRRADRRGRRPFPPAARHPGRGQLAGVAALRPADPPPLRTGRSDAGR